MVEKRKIALSLCRHWLPVAIGVTGLAGLVGVAVPQDYRMSANDLQIQMAEDAALPLGAGREYQTVVPDRQVDIARSLSPFLMVFDEGGQPLASSARLNGAVQCGRMASSPLLKNAAKIVSYGSHRQRCASRRSWCGTKASGRASSSPADRWAMWNGARIN